MFNNIIKCMKTDELSIICSDSVLFFGDNIQVDVSIKSFSFAVKFVFKNDDRQGSGLRLENDSDKLITLECLNFEKLGTGTNRPIKIATVDGKDIYIIFFASMVSEACRKLEFSFCE